MRKLIAIISLALQLVLLLGVCSATLSLIKYWQILWLYGQADDPQVAAGMIASVVTGFLVPFFCGVVGLVLAWWVLRNAPNATSRFRSVMRGLAWATAIFFPLGTLVGAVQFWILKNAQQADAAQA